MAAMGKYQLGNKYRMSLGLPVAACVNCADNSGAKNLYILSVAGIKGCNQSLFGQLTQKFWRGAGAHNDRFSTRIQPKLCRL